MVGGFDADGHHGIELDDGTRLAAGALLASPGVEWRRLRVEGLERLVGTGVYYGAAAAEAPGLSGKHVYVIGGGNSAGQAAVFFADWAESVTMLIRGDGLASSMSTYLIDQIDAADNIELRTGTEVAGVHGDDWLRRIDLVERSGSAETVDAHALFVCIGGEPRTDWAEGTLARDESGYLLTGPDLAVAADGEPRWTLDRDPLFLETTIPGMFAAGDVRHGSTKRVATAVGEGAMAVTLAHRVLGTL